MDIAPANVAPSAPEHATARRLLCAYSPTWLSGPTPGYRGLCPTWVASEPISATDTLEHAII